MKIAYFLAIFTKLLSLALRFASPLLVRMPIAEKVLRVSSSIPISVSTVQMADAGTE